MKKYDNFLAALENLKKIRDYAPPYDIVTETGLVHLFSICLIGIKCSINLSDAFVK